MNETELQTSNMKMDNWQHFLMLTHGSTFLMYFGVGWFIDWYYYTKRRHLAKEWKIQPNKWLSPALVRDEIMFGSLNIALLGSLSALVSCYIYNRNPYTTVYYEFDEYSWLWFFLQFPLIFIYMDYANYVSHRLFHTPWMYKHFHRIHHKYKQPTSFSVTAHHPIESLNIYLFLCLPLLTVPVHWLPYYASTYYMLITGMFCHSGVDFKAQWWQLGHVGPEFHDKHHELFNCNYGINLAIWDRIHGTIKKTKDKSYDETASEKKNDITKNQ